MALSVNFLASGTATAGLNVTFNIDVGAANAGKIVVLGLHQTGGTAGKLITAITIDGVSCLANVTQGQRHGAVWCALPTSAGVVTVNLTYDNAPSVFSFGGWSILGGTGGPTDTQSVFSATNGSNSLNMTIPANGGCVVTGTATGAPAPVTTTNATEDYDTNNGAQQYVGAHTTTTGAVTVTMNPVSSMIGFAFIPAPPAILYTPNPMLPLLVR